MADENDGAAWVCSETLIAKYGPIGLAELDARGLMEWRGGAPLRGPGPGQWALPAGVEGRALPAQPTAQWRRSGGLIPPMTSSDLDTLRRMVDAASPGPWEWWTSNSLRRLSGPDGKDGGVIHAVVHRDGVLDVEVRGEDMEFIGRSRVDFVRLLDEVERCHGLLRVAEKKMHPVMMMDFGTGTVTPAPDEEPLTPGQRAVLEAADEWARGGMLPGSSAESLGQAVRALRESPAVLRIKVTEEQRQEFIQALEERAAAALAVQIASVRVDPAMPPGTMRFEPGGEAPAVTVTNMAADPPVPGPSVGTPDAVGVQTSAPNNDAVGEALFVAYNEQGPNPWKTWDGKDVPRWPALSDQVREKWRAVARASREQEAELVALMRAVIPDGHKLCRPAECAFAKALKAVDGYGPLRGKR